MSLAVKDEKNDTTWKKIVAFGAAAKGCIFLNATNLTDREIDYIIDDNTLKQGLYTPGMNIPIVSIDILEELREKQIAFVPLAWNFFKEIKGKIKTNRDVASDIYIKYFPIIKIE
jgi:hypothetical protein